MGGTGLFLERRTALRGSIRLYPLLENQATDLVSKPWYRSVNLLTQSQLCIDLSGNFSQGRHGGGAESGIEKRHRLQKTPVVFERDANELAAGAHSGSREQLLQCVLDYAFRNGHAGCYFLVRQALNNAA